MGSFKEVVEFAKAKGFNRNSKVIQITHGDLDGTISVINMANYLKPENHKYIHTQYDRVYRYANDALNNNIVGIKDPDFIFLTDIHIEPIEKTSQFVNTDIPVIVLDHHDTTEEVNNLSKGFYVDMSHKVCGAELTYAFLKACGMPTNEHLKALTKITSEYDMWTWVNNKNLEIAGKKSHKAELLNRLYYQHGYGTEAKFIERWKAGWGKGFNAEEIAWLKKDYKDAAEYMAGVEKFELIEGKIIVFVDGQIYYINDLNMEYQDKGYELCIFYSKARGKVSMRGSPTYGGHVGELLAKATGTGTSGGHRLAGGGYLGADKLESFFTTIAESYA
jgi:oligoribonuclease NrnB/cAMP/cGMP phosphodiesterase (DHH superfamily)